MIKLVSKVGRLVLPIFIIICSACFFGCETRINLIVINDGEFSVHFLDVGEGDSILINFPDGKIMLIDSGNTDEAVEEYLLSCIKSTGKKQIDYLVITHPDADHVGNMKKVVETFTVKTAFVPDIRLPDRFPLFSEVLSALTEDNASIIKSDYWQSIKTDEYLVAFLSPTPLGESGSSYNGINASDYPSSQAINDVSPIIYLECRGKRFLFTGDAGVSQENLVMENRIVGAYDLMYGKGVIKLEDIDVLKVAHHGANGSSSEKFLNIIKPKNAVISVGKNNYAHPSSDVLECLVKVNPTVNLLRTDVKGSISMRISSDFMLKIDD